MKLSKKIFFSALTAVTMSPLLVSCSITPPQEYLAGDNVLLDQANYCQVVFSQGQATKIEGQTTFQVKIGKVFGTIEKPIAFINNVKNVGWKDATNDQPISDDFVIDKNLILIPIFPEAVHDVSIYAGDGWFINGTTKTKFKYFDNVLSGTTLSELIGDDLPKTDNNKKCIGWESNIGTINNDWKTHVVKDDENLFTAQFPKPFETCDWNYINVKCTALENNDINEFQFCQAFTVNSQTPTTMDDFIGAEKRVQLDHQDLDHDKDENDYLHGEEVAQTVRVVGTGVDDDSQYQVNTIDTNGTKATLTFEFKDLISDENGYSIASLWQDTTTTTGSNYDYLKSTMRYNLVGEEAGITAPTHHKKKNEADVWVDYQGTQWYTIGDTTHNQDMENICVLDMLPDELANVLKAPQNRVVNINSGSWAEQPITDKLFLPTYKEIYPSGISTYVESSMKGYKFYSGDGGSNTNRIKQQIKGTDGAVTGYTSITDPLYGSGYSYAGYNNSTAGNGAGYWLSSPHTGYTINAWWVNGTGSLSTNYVYGNACAVSPAFCI